MVIVLIGFMGAGKTTVGRLLAARLGLPFADSDEEIEQRYGRRVAEIFATDGEAAFRAAEHEALSALLGVPAGVIAAGGGAVEHPANRPLLRAATVTYLQVSYAEAMRRVGHDAARPLLGRPGLPALYRRRLGLYESVATLTVDAGGRTARSVCGELAARLGPAAGLPRSPASRLPSQHAHRDGTELRGRVRRDRRGTCRLRAGRA